MISKQKKSWLALYDAVVFFLDDAPFGLLFVVALG
jgi:hypothetical protein